MYKITKKKGSIVVDFKEHYTSIKMKVLFLANVPSPYRVDFFNELGKYCNLTVLFEKATSDERDQSWENYKFHNFKGVILSGKSINADTAFCPSALKYILNPSFDRIICATFTDVTGMLAVQIMKLIHIPYYLECDGGFAKTGKGIKEKIKKRIICGATGYFSTGRICDEYYITYGAETSKLIRYPFSSLKQSDLVQTVPSADEKRRLKKELDIKEKKVILAVGQFIYRKGFDILMAAVRDIPKDVGIYFVGGIPTKEYLLERDEKKLSNVHFEGFKLKRDLEKYYKAADLFVLPTREDIWGLVVQEAMAYGLPVISTDKCAAALELIKHDENGYIFPSENVDSLKKYIQAIISSEDVARKFGAKSLEIIKSFTIEEMVECHLNYLQIGEKFR